MSELPTNTASDPLLDTPEAARELNCSQSYLAKARMKGTGPEYVQLGRAIRYRRSALEAYKTAQTRTSTSHAQWSLPPHSEQQKVLKRPREMNKRVAPSLFDV